MSEAEKQPEKGGDARFARGNRTRQALLDAAFDEIHHHGYRAASLNEILKAAGCTKGSLYHHFPDKHALGLAAVAENIDGFMSEIWLKPLGQSEDPITTLTEILARHVNGEVLTDITLGCPLQNLSQEMSGLDEDFRAYLESVHRKWAAAIADALKKGQVRGQVRTDIDPQAVAIMIIATHQGTVGLMKTAQDASIGDASASAAFQYFESLRPDGQNKGQAS